MAFNNFRGEKTSNGLLINCLMGKCSPTWTIESGTENHEKTFQSCSMIIAAIEFPEIGIENLVPCWFGAPESSCCSITSSSGELLVSLWQIADQFAIFHTCLVSILLCSGVIDWKLYWTAYSISQHLGNAISALLNMVLLPAFDELSPNLGCLYAAELSSCVGGLSFPCSVQEADCSSQALN